MSIKQLFGKKSGKILPNSSVEEVGQEIESVKALDSLRKEKERVIPEIDFIEPANFARFGSSNKYYNDAIKLIYKTYPYDGSRNEKTEWHNSCSLLTNYVFDNLYPKSTGYINFGLNYGFEQTSDGEYSETTKLEYILIKGGPNTYSQFDEAKSLFGKSNYFDETKKRASNLNLNGEDGVTVEFYLKKQNSLGSPKQVIFDLWNSSSFGRDDYGRFIVETSTGVVGSENSIFVSLLSGSSGAFDVELSASSISDDKWHHYAVVVFNYDTNLKFQLFQDGVLQNEVITGSAVSQVYGPMNATIGCLITQHIGGNADFGWGKLSGSLDEFRYWKTARTDKDIQRFYFTEVYGGTNTDDANTDLGVYFKFNEGIFDTSSLSAYDSNIIDYSGRISNAIWYGNSLESRNTGSAIIESGFSQEEPADPVLYPNHPSVLALLEEIQQKTIAYDQENNASIYNSFASWILDEDEENGKGLLELTQIMSEFFDEFYFYIKNLPNLKDQEYRDANPLPFSKKLLESSGLNALELFGDSSILESFLSRNEVDVFEEKLYHIKNTIYQNIYNNLLYIYRSKGTEKSIRNLLRCFGVDTELVKLNLYADDQRFTFEERYEYTAQKRKYINFNSPDNFEGTVYQVTQSGNPNILPYVKGKLDSQYLGNTLEVETIFPRKFAKEEDFYFETPFLTCSLFGMHEPKSISDNMTWSDPDHASIQVFAIRPEKESNDAYFMLSSSFFNIELTSSLYKDVYTDQKWLFAYRIKHEKYPLTHAVTGALEGNYIVELYGINTVLDIVEQEFLLSASIDPATADEYFTSPKKIYLGSHRQNFTGSVIVGEDQQEQLCDAQIGAARFWVNYITDDVLKSHAFDITQHGPKSMSENVENFLDNELKGFTAPQAETLALYWNFDLIESSDNGSGSPITNLNDAGFNILDISSGSSDTLTRYPLLSELTRQNHPGRADFFLRNNSAVVSYEYVQNAKIRLPEILNNDDLINIVERDDLIYTRDTLPVNYYFSIEKSMYQNISEEMLRWIGTIKQFNNLIGEPTNRYEANYRKLDFLRRLFFSNIDNTPDFEKFVEFYKWIDESVGKIVAELIPASANTVNISSNIVESHILERNKYRHKLPTIEFKGKDPIVAVRTINELKYNWKFGHAPIPLDENTNCLWWKVREEKTGNREKIFETLQNTFERELTTVYDLNIEPIVIIDKNPKEYDLVINTTSFGTQNFYEIDLTYFNKKPICYDNNVCISSGSLNNECVLVTQDNQPMITQNNLNLIPNNCE